MVLVLVFLAGLTHEFLNVLWVHYAEKSAPGRAALIAAINASVALAGLAQSLDSIRAAVCFVAGETAGTFLGVWFAKRNDRADRLGSRRRCRRQGRRPRQRSKIARPVSGPSAFAQSPRIGRWGGTRARYGPNYR